MRCVHPGEQCIQAVDIIGVFLIPHGQDTVNIPSLGVARDRVLVRPNTPQAMVVGVNQLANWFKQGRIQIVLPVFMSGKGKQF